MDSLRKIDKSVFKIVRNSDDLDEEHVFWLSKTPLERLEAIEFLREQFMKLYEIPAKIDKSVFEIRYGK